MMLSAQSFYQDPIDDDPIPWYRFPDYLEKEKMLSYLTVNGEEPEDSTGIRMQSGKYVFRGECGTDYQPPGLELNVTWSFLHAKHPPPGLPFPTMLPPCFSTPVTFSQSTASAMQSVLRKDPDIIGLAVERSAVDPAEYEPNIAVDEKKEASCRGLLPRMAVFCSSMEPAETATETARESADQDSPATDSLIQDLEELDLEEVGTVSLRPLIVSSDEWVQRRGSSQMRESSDENSAVSNSSNLNTPERRISNKTSNTSLKSGSHDPRP